MNNKIFTYAKAIIIPLAIGTIVGLIMMGAMDYETLNKPNLAPPGAVFPIVWTILYILMGISYGILQSNGLADKEISKAYYIQLVINALWSIIFFNLKWRLFAFIWIILLIISVVNMIIKFYNKNKIAGIIQIPYLFWTIFATYLNLAFYVLNR